MIHPKLDALLATSRVANIPSVVSNVWVGIAVGIALNIPPYEKTQESPVPWLAATLLVLAGICLYVSGNFFNDWMDRDWDKERRPERAMPRGFFTPDSYRNTASVLAFTGVLLAALVNWTAGVTAIAIVGCIAAYTIRHKRDDKAVVFMGLCRALLPVMGAVGLLGRSVDTGMLFPTFLAGTLGGLGLFCYIVGLSISARQESKPPSTEKATPLRWFLFGFPILMIVVSSLSSKNPMWLSFAGVAPYAGWLAICHTRFLKPVSAYVSSLLAGIPLVDWMILIPFSLWELTMPTPRFPDDPLCLLSLAIPPLAFVSALLLQRLAPAT